MDHRNSQFVTTTPQRVAAGRRCVLHAKKTEVGWADFEETW